MAIAFGRTGLLVVSLVVCVLADGVPAPPKYKWDRELTEKLVGSVAPTVYPFSSPLNVDINTIGAEKLAECDAVLGKWVHQKWIHKPNEKYNVTEALINLGGYPGTVKATRNENAPEAYIDPDIPLTQRPLPFPTRQNWLYEFNATDYASYIRVEQATKRLAGKAEEFVDISGKIAWTPADMCGWMLLATYRLDDTGLHSEIRPSLMEFQNNGTVLAIRHAPVCFPHADGSEHCI